MTIDEKWVKAVEAELGDAHVKCFRAIMASGDDGLTCEEVEQKTGLRHQTASARVRELYQRGLIKDKGVRRETSSKRTAIIWVLKHP